MLSPLTAPGVSGVGGGDAGAASGVVNAAHKLGNSLGLAVLVAISAFRAGALDGRELLVHQVTTALTAGAMMLGLALILVLALVMRPCKALKAGAPA